MDYIPTKHAKSYIHIAIATHTDTHIAMYTFVCTCIYTIFIQLVRCGLSNQTNFMLNLSGSVK